LHKINSFKYITKELRIKLNTVDDFKKNLEKILIYGRGHNLYDIFYGKYKNDEELKYLKAYIDAAPRKVFADILDKIDKFVFFNSKKIVENERK